MTLPNRHEAAVSPAETGRNPPMPIRAEAFSGTWQRAKMNGWSCAGIFLAALAGFNLVLDACLPLPNVGEVSEKLAYFARHKDEFDAVFIGSSRVCRQVAPSAFDRETAPVTGQSMHSFNLGAPSMFLPESLFVIDRIIELKPARLRWMFIELNEPRPRLEEHAGLVRREVYWHDLRETLLTCVNIFRAAGIHKRDRLTMLAHQWQLFGRRWTHLGRASEWLAACLSPPEPSDPAAEEYDALGPASDGYYPYRATLGDGKGAGRGGVEDVRAYLAAATALKTGRTHEQTPSDAPALLRWLLAEKIHALRAYGIEPLFVIAPVTTDEQEFLRLSKQGTVRPLFAFNDPKKYPDLYEINARADTMHLNERGSLLFTKLLAEKFIDYRANAPR